MFMTSAAGDNVCW